MGSLGAPWEAHGKVWDPFGVLWAALGASGVLLGSPWGASGATAAGTGGDLGSFWEPSGRFRKPLEAFGLREPPLSENGEPLGILTGSSLGKPKKFPYLLMDMNIYILEFMRLYLLASFVSYVVSLAVRVP